MSGPILGMAHPVIDVDIASDTPMDLILEKHIQFLSSFDKKTDPMLEYLKLSAIYWCLTALDLMGKLDVIDKDKVIQFVQSCQKSDGGLAPAPGHDSHMLSTLSGIQILVLYNELEKIDRNKVVDYIAKLQNPDGSFNGDKWGEVDSRFSFCAIASMSLLGLLRSQVPDLSRPVKGVDLEMAANFLVRCQNRDGGFGTRPGSESHAGQAYCVVGAMSLLGQLRRLDTGKAAWWLAERQLPSGGLNGRPGKQPDVCYSWWVLATLCILGRLMWINAKDLCRFIVASQDTDTGGISDRPGNHPDPFHTLFGLAGLSLLSRPSSGAPMNDGSSCNGSAPSSDVKSAPEAVLSSALHSLRDINPVFCMPQYVIDSISVHIQTL
ncbi:unnamed protein product [Schistocephalus solidus]|uniref:Geranylgeranyl transferase type-2 subunit beta n=1 Tax=Schistocephalus solidus TaxID=70667 RepID=A0A3P7F0L1_SCHSO|nr:unnamed protein product [Schistocephalus solidus]